MRRDVEVFVDSRDYAMTHEVRLIVRPFGRPPMVGQLAESGRFEYVEFPEYGECKPSFVLEAGEMEALAKALSPWKSRDVAPEALDDARATRDRLLSLVERMVP